ncbi:MAG: hypothetical protein JNM94_08650 [Phycisphaerae bacterium]|nr:hypothetical protein [Phycisphaerae bacterium]
MPEAEVAPEWALDDERRLRDPRMAKTALIAGIASVVLAPVVVGALPGAIGLHSGRTHLRTRLGSRGLAWTGIVLSALGTLLAAASAVTFGMILMLVLLQRSAIEQARGWVGTHPEPWSIVATDGTTFSPETTRGSIVLIDIFAPQAPVCRETSTFFAAFAAAHPELKTLSWAPEGGAESEAFARDHGAAHPVAIGPHPVGDPFIHVAAKPTLLVIDAEGVVRAAVLGRYDAEGLRKLVEEAGKERQENGKRK